MDFEGFLLSVMAVGTPLNFFLCPITFCFVLLSTTYASSFKDVLFIFIAEGNLHRLCHAFAEFINLISSESNEVCSREEKRTIAPEHVLKALQVFDQHIWAYCSVSNLVLVFSVVSFVVLNCFCPWCMCTFMLWFISMSIGLCIRFYRFTCRLYLSEVHVFYHDSYCHIGLCGSLKEVHICAISLKV